MNLSMIRPYEMSLWTLQDSFITVLKGINTSFQGQLITPEILIKSDGTQELKFSIPMYCRDDSGELIENPIWYNTRNGNLMVNLRKIKVIFNKGDKGEEKVYEFVITKVKETHSKGQLICEVETEGLAFHELGKTGYKLVLNYDEFFIDADINGDGTLQNEDLTATLDYWLDKVFKNTNWDWEIQMDWSAYDGIIDNNDRIGKSDVRQPNKVYEEGYVVSWSYDSLTNSLIPTEVKKTQEKARIPEIEKSNRYNITQTLAELFGVFCKYEYSYDNNYHIIGRKCIFYNNFFEEDLEKIDINYPYNTDEIVREGDSTDVITKMYVTSGDDIGIQDVLANKMGEDYILNFDYLYEIGTISDEQFKEVDIFSEKISILNYNAKEESKKLIILQQEKNELDASFAVTESSISVAEEKINNAKQIKLSLYEGRTSSDVLRKDLKNPLQAILYDEGNGFFGIRNLGLEGIDVETIKIYTEYKKDKGIPEDSPYIKFSEENATFDKVTKKNLESIHGLSTIIKKDENGNEIPETISRSIKVYITCDYCPAKKYDNIIEIYSKRLAEDEKKKIQLEEEIKKKEEEIKKLEDTLNEIYENQRILRANFENMMGPALREGSWQPDEITDSGDKYYVDIKMGEENEDKLIKSFWDNELFDDEENHYTTVSILETPDYYPMIELNSQMIQEFFDNENLGKGRLCLRYTLKNKDENEEYFYLAIESQMKYGFVQEKGNSSIMPVLYITKTLSDAELTAVKNGEFGNLKYMAYGDEVQEEFYSFTPKITLTPNLFLNGANYETVYPRFEINSDNLKDSDEAMRVQIKKNSIYYTLEKYSQYYVLFRDSKYYITIKPEVYLQYWQPDSFTLTYIISNANLHLYLDALEVSKTNAYPQVSYEVSVSALNQDIVKTLYKYLNRIVNINDGELKFKNVHGYISELTLKLDSPWQDEIKVQNYKTKFEDLFSRIVASTETMKTNTLIYNRAANAFTTTGLLTAEVIQSTLSRVDLNYAFNKGKLTINEKNGIWGTSDSGVVAFRGGGIFCATEQDFNGNWIWHTGIVPEGINASLLTAGVIDTNVIRIFAGDNIRFQMNATGLYAFKETVDALGEPATDFNNYLVQNSEGLFLIEKIPETQDGVTSFNINRRVEISWDGFILRDGSGEIVFYADPENGKLILKGNIYANEGEIGGWIIGENYLISQEKVYLLQYDENGEVKVDEEGKPIYGDLVKIRQVGIASNPNKNNEIKEDDVYDAIVVGRIINAQTNEIEKEGFLVRSDGTVLTNFIKATHITADSAAIGGVYISDVISQLDEVKIQPLTGEIFKWSLEEETPHNTSLKFTILSGIKKNINHNTWTIWRTTDFNGEWENIGTLKDSNYVESFDVNTLTFYLKYDIMMFGEEESKKRKDVVYIKITTIQNQSTEEEAEIESEILTLYNVYDGMDGIVDFVILHASDLIFYYQENGSYSPEKITISAELHGNLTEEKGYWTKDEDKVHINSGLIEFDITPNDLTNGMVTYYYHQPDLPKPYSISIGKIKNGKDGKDAESLLTVLIDSSSGTVFNIGEQEMTLTARLFLGNQEILKPEEFTNLDPSLNYWFIWKGPNEKTEIVTLKEGLWENTLIAEAKNVYRKGVYSCEVNLLTSE